MLEGALRSEYAAIAHAIAIKLEVRIILKVEEMVGVGGSL